MRKVALVWYTLQWPRSVEAEQLVEAFRLLAAIAKGPIVIESIGKAGRVTHYIAVPYERAGNVVQQLQSAIPGLGIDAVESHPRLSIDRAIALRLSNPKRALRTDDLLSTNRAMLTALSHVGPGEQLVLQWVLGTHIPPNVVPSRLSASSQQSWMHALLTAPAGIGKTVDPEFRTALQEKQSQSGWKLAGRIGVQAASPSRQRQLVAQVLGALRTSQSPGVSFWVQNTNVRNVTKARVPFRQPVRLNVVEMAAISTWSVGETSDLPVRRLGSRLMPPARAIRSKGGRVVGEATFPGKERSLVQLPTDALRHTLAIGPTGVGKSTLLENMILGDIAAGHSVVVIEPKGHLINAILRRLPQSCQDDVVVIDPTDAEKVVGLNVFASNNRPELIADQLLNIFHSLFDSWGPRTSDILHASALTLAQTPDATLVSLLLLLTDRVYRRKVVSKLDDPIALENFWASYEKWSDQERANAIAPAMRRLRPFLLRPDVRAMVGQSKPRFELSELFTSRRIVLCDLSKGALGAEACSLLGSLLISQIWNAAIARSSTAPEQRKPVYVYADEWQNYLHLSTDLSEALAEARGYGLGFVLANQYLDQLGNTMQQAALSNVQSKIAFRLPHKDAVTLAAGSKLAPEDFESLGRFQCYAQLVASSEVQPWCSMTTLPSGDVTSDPEKIRKRSRERYGQDRNEVEASLRQLVQQRDADGGDDIGIRRRSKGDDR